MANEPISDEGEPATSPEQIRVIKLKISSDFLKNIGLSELFINIKFVEISEIYQFDRMNFFSVQKIILQPETARALNKTDQIDEMIKKQFKVQFYQKLEQTGDEILCIMKQRSDVGFWPLLLSGPWAIIPPITVDSEAIITTIITRKEFIQKKEGLFEILQKYTKSFEILAINDLQKALEKFAHPMPSFTERQREIATFAMRNGFFESPKKITANEIAKKFGISVSAVNDHIRKVEKTVMRYFFS
jgi:predicted DNA binding protein